MIGTSLKGSISTRVSQNPTWPKGKGSWEGFMHSPKAHIYAENTGYLAKVNQTARNSPRKPTNLMRHNINPLSIQVSSSTNVYDSRMMGRPGSSKARLDKQMRLDKMF